MLAASALYRQALPFPHRRVTRVQAFQGGVRVGDELGVVEGEVSARLTSRVTRTLSMAVDPVLFPDTVAAVLSPYATVLRVSTGIGYPDGSREVFDVFTGRVWDAEKDGAGGVQIGGQDLAADVIGFQFEQPEPSVVGATAVAEIHRLIRQVLPDAVFGVDTVGTVLVPQLVWDQDRGKALDDLAAAASGRWYALGDGSFVVRAYPYTVGVPVLALSDGPGGTVGSATRSVTRDGTANSVTVVSERMDGTAPVRVTARDMTPGSPTFFGGPYGRVSKIIKVQTPLTQGEAQQLAVAQLAASTALTEQWSLSCIPDATLEPGDTVSVSYRGTTAVQIIDSITYPLTTGTAMALQTRSSTVAPVAT